MLIDLTQEIPVSPMVALAAIPCFLLTIQSYFLYNSKPDFIILLITFCTGIIINIWLPINSVLYIHTLLIWILGLPELDLSILNDLFNSSILMSSSAGGGSNTGSGSGHGGSGNTNSGSGLGNGGSGKTGSGNGNAGTSSGNTAGAANTHVIPPHVPAGYIYAGVSV